MPTALQVIPIGENGKLQEAFNVRLEELNVKDIAFMAACYAVPTIAVLFEDTKGRHARTYELQARPLARGGRRWCHFRA